MPDLSGGCNICQGGCGCEGREEKTLCGCENACRCDECKDEDAIERADAADI